MKVYCDMDGVLVDLMGGVGEALGYKIEDPHQFPQTASDNKIPWDIINTIPLFWESLDWMPDGKELWNSLMEICVVERDIDVCILSARAEGDWNSPKGKLNWLAAHLNSELFDVHIVERKDKKNFAMNGNERNILIDDYQKNIREWIAAGGIGILHQDTQVTIQKLKETLESV